MYERSHLQLLIKRIEEPRRFITVVLGPRQVGKTTVVGQLINQIKIPHLFISADAVPISNTIWVRQQWESARIKMQTENANEFLLVIDEIQKIDNWSEIVKSLWDTDTREKKELKVIYIIL